MLRIPSLLAGALLLALTSVPAMATTIADPFGDTLGVVAPQHDIEAISGEVVGSFLLVSLEFFAPLTLVGQGGDEFGGVVFLDTDQNTATGGSFLGLNGFDWQVEFGNPLQDVNLDYFVPVIDNDLGDGDQSFLAPVFATGETLQVFLLLSALADDGIADFFVVAANTGEITDIAPQTVLGEPTTVTTSVPEPGTVAMLSLGLLGLLGCTRPRGRVR